MTKYRVLIAGKNSIFIDEFFSYTGDSFLTVTTSGRDFDILNHLDFFKPDVFLFCLGNDRSDDLNKLKEYQNHLRQNHILFAIVGSREDCDRFQELSLQMADIVFYRPVTVGSIKEQLLQLIGAHPQTTAEPAVSQPAIPSRPSRPAEVRKSARPHILVIDDDPVMLRLVKEYLHGQYNVATAINGKVAMKFLEKKHTDLILLDYEMPLEDGPSVYQKIRSTEALSKIPIVFLTGVSDRTKIQTALQLKPQGYILKPIEKEKLLNIVKGCLI